VVWWDRLACCLTGAPDGRSEFKAAYLKMVLFFDFLVFVLGPYWLFLDVKVSLIFFSLHLGINLLSLILVFSLLVAIKY
jgi:hypothetical protein